MKKKLLMAVVASVLSFSNVGAYEMPTSMGSSRTDVGDYATARTPVPVEAYLIGQLTENGNYRVIDSVIVRQGNFVFHDGVFYEGDTTVGNIQINCGLPHPQIARQLARSRDFFVMVANYNLNIIPARLSEPDYYNSLIQRCVNGTRGALFPFVI